VSDDVDREHEQTRHPLKRVRLQEPERLDTQVQTRVKVPGTDTQVQTQSRSLEQPQQYSKVCLDTQVQTRVKVPATAPAIQ